MVTDQITPDHNPAFNRRLTIRRSASLAAGMSLMLLAAAKLQVNRTAIAAIKDLPAISQTTCGLPLAQQVAPRLSNRMKRGL
jgi:hypothetical protein